MRRFYSPCHNITSDTITITDPKQIHHIRDVLRLKAGSEIIIFDARKNEYLSEIEEIQAQKIIFKMKTKIKSNAVSGLKISVACAIPKKSKMSDIIDKLTQLGIDRIIPLETERVIVKMAGQKRDARLERWQTIALNACQQSQRKELPVIEPIKTMDEVLLNSQAYDLKLIPTLEGQRRPLKEVFLQARPTNILIFIGPEGDFTGKEVAMAKKYGCIPVSLGSLVLRVDTACLAVVSFIRLLSHQ